MTIRNNTGLYITEEDDQYVVKSYSEPTAIPSRLNRESLDTILYESWHQDRKYNRSNNWLTSAQWLAILMEEVGEVATEVLGVEFHEDKLAAVDRLRAEAIQVATVAFRLVEAIDRGQLLDEV